MHISVRKITLGVEEVRHDGGPELHTSILKGWIGAVVANPYAGRFVTDITPMMEALKPLGLECSQRLLAALGSNAAHIEAYGKGAIVGAAGEIEHSALWHVPGGYAMREVLGDHKDACYVRSHFDAMTAMIPDAPRANEIAFFLTMTTGGRPHARVGGLQISEIAKRDGMR
jgi:hypothetical protein